MAAWLASNFHKLAIEAGVQWAKDVKPRHGLVAAAAIEAFLQTGAAPGHSRTWNAPGRMLWPKLMGG
jgi:hypothetical protein